MYCNCFGVLDLMFMKALSMLLLTCTQELLDEADKILLLDGWQLLSYDTTFLLGDFYVSPLIFRHTIFREKPCIPVMFLLHERKLSETHQQMFKECLEAIPSLKKTTCPIVTDKEQGILDALRKQLPNITIVHCWNHLFRDIRLWLRKHGAPSNDIAVYSDDVQKLFHSTSEQEYLQLLSQIRPTWDPVFEEYFLKQFHPDVNKSIGRWVLENLNIYDPYSGVTNNQSEGFNRVVKDVQDWKEAPVDSMVLALYQLQTFYLNEIRRGLAGMGEYHLTDKYADIQASYAAFEYIPCSCPAEIIDKIRDSALQIENMAEKEEDNEVEEDPEPEVPTTPKSQLSTYARAKMAVKDGNITFDPKLHVFNVKGTSGVTRVVTLFPHETCSCPSAGACYHIIAVKLSVGIEVADKPSSKSLTKLRKCTQTKKDKRSGRKRPRVNDIDKQGLLLFASVAP